jgi:two-component sensor histidine kinase
MVQALSSHVVDSASGGESSNALLLAQNAALKLAIAGEPLGDVLNVLVSSAAQRTGGRAAIFLVDELGALLRFACAEGLPEAYTRAIDGFLIGPSSPSCGNAAYTGERVVVGDVGLDPLWKPFLALAQEHGIKACWSTPIRTFEGQVLGTLAVYHDVPRQPTVRDLEEIDFLAHTASLLIARDHAERAREVALEQARASDLLAMEMSHRIMNSFQVVQALVAMQAKGSAVREVGAALDSVSARLHAMAGMHRLLLKGAQETLGSIDLTNYLEELVASVGSAFISGTNLTLAVDVEAGTQLPAVQVSAVGLITTELVMNALKHASPDGRSCQIDVELKESDGFRRLTISDDGIGLPPEPEKPKGTGLGMKVIRSLAGQLGGSVDVERLSAGVAFHVKFPVLASV